MKKFLQKARDKLPVHYGSVVLLLSFMTALFIPILESEGPVVIIIASLAVVGLGGAVTLISFLLHFQFDHKNWLGREMEIEPLLRYEPWLQATGGIGMILFSFFGVRFFLS